MQLNVWIKCTLHSTFGCTATLEFFPKNLNDGSGTPEFQGNIYEQLLGDKGDGAKVYYKSKIDAIAAKLASFKPTYVSCLLQWLLVLYTVRTASLTRLLADMLACSAAVCTLLLLLLLLLSGQSSNQVQAIAPAHATISRGLLNNAFYPGAPETLTPKGTSVTRPDGQYQTAKALFNRAYAYVIQTFKDNGATNVAFQVVVNNNNGRGSLDASKPRRDFVPNAAIDEVGIAGFNGNYGGQPIGFQPLFAPAYNDVSTPSKSLYIYSAHMPYTGVLLVLAATARMQRFSSIVNLTLVMHLLTHCHTFVLTLLLQLVGVGKPMFISETSSDDTQGPQGAVSSVSAMLQCIILCITSAQCPPILTNRHIPRVEGSDVVPLEQGGRW
eukprot:3996-Heterococcus_DN1.PRE.5